MTVFCRCLANPMTSSRRITLYTTTDFSSFLTSILCSTSAPMMPSALGTSALGAFEASLSVLLTLFYGVLAARLGMLRPSTASDISNLCRTFFLPALLLTSIGSQLTASTFSEYLPVFVWSASYAVLSLLLGKLSARVLGLPKWTVAAVVFNNTTSLPLLLTKSLATTGILAAIAGGDVSDAVERAQGYFLINSMVSNAATFSFGPKLLEEKEPKAVGEEEQEEEQEDVSIREADETEADEETSLLPKPVAARFVAVEESTYDQFHRLPRRVQSILVYLSSLLTPTLWGAILAIVVGVTPLIHKALFSKAEKGGFLNPWLTSSLRNIGDLFTALQMFVVGSNFSSSLTPPASIPRPNPQLKSFATIFIIRFLFWSIVSPLVIYFLATRTQLLSDDPMLWWSMMLMPIGPPAMMISTLVETTGASGKKQREKMVVARTLAYMYIVTPVMCLSVVGALRACEMISDTKGQTPGVL